MALVGLKGLPILDVPQHDLERLNLKMVQSDAIAFGDSSPVSVFDIPANTQIVSLVLEVATAFDVASSMQFGITGTATKYGQLTQSLRTAGFYTIPVGLEESVARTLIATISAAGAAAGSVVVWIVYRPNSEEQKWIKNR